MQVDILTSLPASLPQGTCEYEGAPQGIGGGGVAVEEGRARALTTDRVLYNLPTFVAPMQGCQKLSECQGGQGEWAGGSAGMCDSMTTSSMQLNAHTVYSASHSSPGPP